MRHMVATFYIIQGVFGLKNGFGFDDGMDPFQVGTTRGFGITGVGSRGPGNKAGYTAIGCVLAPTDTIKNYYQ